MENLFYDYCWLDSMICFFIIIITFGFVCDELFSLHYPDIELIDNVTEEIIQEDILKKSKYFKEECKL